MSAVGILALVANASVALMLYRFRTGDSSMRSVWICSRNDAIGNLAVIAAAAGVFGTGTGWPDLIVAAIMAGLSISGGWQIVRQARGELRSEQAIALCDGDQPISSRHRLDQWRRAAGEFPATRNFR